MVGLVQLTAAIAAITGVVSAEPSVIERSHPLCDQFDLGQTCQGIASKAGISLQTFLNLNPSLNPATDCDSVPGLWWCIRTRAPGAPISTPTPASQGMFPDCAKFARGAGIGGSCYDMVPDFKILPEHWSIWNPAYNYNDFWSCVYGMPPGRWFCVAAMESWTPPPTTSTRPTSTIKTTTKPKATSTKRPKYKLYKE
ncbi:hypothetical protein ACHAPT_008044 [Fusarium lateritium]